MARRVAKKPLKTKKTHDSYGPGQHPNSRRNLTAAGRAKGAAKPGEQRALTRGVYADPQTVVTPSGVVYRNTEEFCDAVIKDGAIVDTRFMGLVRRYKSVSHEYENLKELNEQGRLTAREQKRFDQLGERLTRWEREMGLTPASAVEVGLKAQELANERQKQLAVRPILTNAGKLRLLYQLARNQLLPGLYLLRDEDLDAGDPTFAIPRIRQLIREGKVPDAFISDVPDASAFIEEER
jgi:hypothetical protein